jgi:ABC-type Fe3+ transport system substrate-binding protein
MLAVYGVAKVANAPHPEAARTWINFIRSDATFSVFEQFGFKRYEAKPQ